MTPGLANRGWDGLELSTPCLPEGAVFFRRLFGAALLGYGSYQFISSRHCAQDRYVVSKYCRTRASALEHAKRLYVSLT